MPPSSLSAPQVAALRRSWELVTPIADEVAQLFYARLFELDPALRDLFHSEPEIRRQKLMDALTAVVKFADEPAYLASMLKTLGDRHDSYGVRDEHYVTCGNALLWTLDQGLGLLETAETRDAWVALWTFVAAAMRGQLDGPSAQLLLGGDSPVESSIRPDGRL